MSTNEEICTAVDAIRCVYLARMACRRGNAEAARRWQAKATRWLQAQGPLDFRQDAENPAGP
jgi:hypothetical protein